MSDLADAVKFLTEARRRFAKSSDIEEARLLKTTITGLEKHFTGGAITSDEEEAFMSIFFGGPLTGRLSGERIRP